MIQILARKNKEKIEKLIITNIDKKINCMNKKIKN